MYYSDLILITHSVCLVAPISVSFSVPDIPESIISQKNEREAINGTRKWYGTTPNVRHCTGIQNAQYRTNKPSSLTC